MGIFLFLFIVMPIVEMTILIKVGTMIGALNTIGLVLLTAIIGAALLRQQGLATLLKANQRLNSGELPAKEVAEGLEEWISPYRIIHHVNTATYRHNCVSEIILNIIY